MSAREPVLALEEQPRFKKARFAVASTPTKRLERQGG